MRFFKGSKVEVLQEAEVPLGSWRPAEIVSGNGHSYCVRYDRSMVDSGAAVERVPRRLMRPCPPPSDDPVCWTAGNILEAFDSYSWKVAEMVGVLGKNYYEVRLLGSSLELRVHVWDVRLRKLWQDDKWIVIQKDSARCSGGSFRGQSKDGKFGSKLSKHQQLHRAVDNHLLLKNHNMFEGDMSRGVKRKSSAISTHPTQRSEVTKRMRTPHGDGRHSQLVAGCSLHFAEKGRSWRLEKHPSVGPCRWRSLPHGLQCDKCGNISIELPLVFMMTTFTILLHSMIRLFCECVWLIVVDSIVGLSVVSEYEFHLARSHCSHNIHGSSISTVRRVNSNLWLLQRRWSLVTESFCALMSFSVCNLLESPHR